MSATPKWTGAVLVGIGCAAVGLVLAAHYLMKGPNPPEAPRQSAPAPAFTHSPPIAQPAGPAPLELAASPEETAEPPVAESARGARRRPSRSAGAPAGAPAGGVPAGKGDLQNPEARVALASVGIDPKAARIWLDAINDPDLPAAERKDLIEDLNEDGFPDPDNLTKDDLPLIVARIGIIENIAADALDDVNAAAFDEAYKDLLNMHARLTGR